MSARDNPLPRFAMLASFSHLRSLSLSAFLLAAAAPASSAQDACSGGPGGDFDWVIKNGETFIFDTNATTILGGPGGLPTTVQNSVGGRVEVRDLIIEEGGELRAQGPHPVRICATGDVVIRGTLDVGGFNAKSVATLNTGNQVERGGVGGPGGGKGGDANSVTIASTPCGSPGFGPGEAPAGGGGGESGFAPRNLGKDARRPGGGGGGRFAADQGALVASPGFPGSPLTTGAKSGSMPALGGAAGVGPFVDADSTNDFLGVRPILGQGGEILGLVRGELRRLAGGFGGGGGGNAIPASSFPNPTWSIGSDEKGGPGGGGGGTLHVRALGKIVFGTSGVIRSNGGRGGTGENTNFLDHIGGSGGSGSGGHVVLESSTQIDFTDGDPLGAPVRDWIQALGGTTVIGPKGNQGGSLVPCGISHGGSGGPGVVQLHVPLALFLVAPDPGAGIVIPLAAAGAANPLGEVAAPDPILLLPTARFFGTGDAVSSGSH